MPDSFWVAEGLKHITPRGKENPEGWDVLGFLAAWAGDDTVLDFGCGPGRLAGAFDAERYVGIDVNPAALAAAAERHPEHRFEAPAEQVADRVIAWTVLLHIEDARLPGIAADLRRRAPRVLVAEILGRELRHPMKPPCFNRDLSDYEAAFGEAPAEVWEEPYAHYPGRHITIMEWR